jgi:hypothetical protein
VLLLRIAVIIVLVVCATAIAFTIYHITQSAEIGEFNIQYEGASEKVLKAFEDVLRVHAGALSSLSVAITTQGECLALQLCINFIFVTITYLFIFFHCSFTAMDQKAQLPFVTLNSFQRRASVTLSLSGALYLSINHYVEENDRNAWETYATLDEANYLSESYEYFEDLDYYMKNNWRKTARQSLRCLHLRECQQTLVLARIW